jgi:hypothetical protein
MTGSQRQNARKAWTSADDEVLVRLAGEKVHPKAIAAELGRSMVSVMGRANKLGVSIPEVKPTKKD